MSIQKLLIEIYDAGLNDYEIAEKIGAPQSIINRLRHGKLKSVLHERGKKIEALHSQIKPKVKNHGQTEAA
jgi:ribosome-binding protein aMBF1 (putative translation factor)